MQIISHQEIYYHQNDLKLDRYCFRQLMIPQVIWW